MSRSQGVERRASDASLLGLSMEARMTRIESMMESLLLERGLAVTPRISIERDASASERLHADFLMQIAGEASTLPSLAAADVDGETSPKQAQASVSAPSPSSSTDAAGVLRVGTKTIAFPNPTEYQKHLNVFFDDIAPYYPCVNELEFRMESEKMLSAPAISSGNVSLLALNYIVFACSEMATSQGTPTFVPVECRTHEADHVETEGTPTKIKPPGWQWFRAADDLVGKRKLSGQADLCLIQFLALEV